MPQIDEGRAAAPLSRVGVMGGRERGWGRGVIAVGFLAIAHAASAGVMGLSADLTITKDDGTLTAIPGETVTYTITAANPAGPDAVVGASVADTFPAELDCTWTCAASAGATCMAGPVAGDLADTVDLAVGASATYTAVCDVDAAATGEIVNTATVTPPAGVDDPDLVDNAATDTDVLTPLADLAITKGDGVDTAVPGETVIYTLAATNAGPSDVLDAVVTDDFPAELTCTWTCVPSAGASCTAGPVAGDLADLVDLAAGASATYTAVCAIDSAATISVVNIASIAVPDGVTDLEGENDSASDGDILSPMADLEISKDDGSTTAVPGTSVSYMVTVVNQGPSDAPGATVGDVFPADLAGVSWTCAPSGGASCTASGSGDLADSADIPAGGSVIYTATGTVDAAATGTLSNTATVTPPAAVPDPDTADNSATDVDDLVPTADLAVDKDDGQTTAVPGTEVTWAITVANGGPSVIVGASVTDVFPAEVSGVTWTCFGSEGGVCGTASGSGDLDETIDLAVDASVIYSATATFDPSATGNLVNTASVAVPAGSVDPQAANDSATDVDTLDLQADLAITKTDDGTVAIFGVPLTYTLTVTNGGPGDAASASVIDMFPGLEDVEWTCSTTGAATCGGAGTGTLNDAVSVPVGDSVIYSATGTVELDAVSPLVNTASVLPTGGLSDPDATNNSATDDDTELVPGTDLAVTKDDGRTTAGVGDQLDYVIEVENLGPADVFAAEVTDTFPTELEGCIWSCFAAGQASCAAGLFTGDIFDIVDIPVGDSVTFFANCVVAAGAETIVNTASVTLPESFADPDLINNSATDVTSVALFADGFESGDTSSWSSTMPPSSPFLGVRDAPWARRLGDESGDTSAWSSASGFESHDPAIQ